MSKNSALNQKDEHKVFETPEEQILHRPGMWIGSTHTILKDIFGFKSGSFVSQELDFNPGIAKLIEEVIINSADEHNRTSQDPKLRGWVLDKIEVNVDQDGKVQVKDNGGISIYKHSTLDTWSVENIFGKLFSSSNYEDDKSRTAVGTNGVGASLANLFSKDFKVTTADGKQVLTIEWLDNKSVRSEPVLQNSTEHFTNIEYQLELSRFGLEAIPLGVITYIERLCLILAAAYPGLEVCFNGDSYKFKSFKEYVELYGANQIIGEAKMMNQPQHLYTPYTTDEELTKLLNETPGAIMVRKSIIILGEEREFEVYVTPTYGEEAQRFGIVNGAECNEGTHIKGLEDRIRMVIEDHIRDNKIKFMSSITQQQINSAYHMFVKFTVDKPQYNSQAKEELTTDIRFYDEKLNRLRIPMVTKEFEKQLIESDIFLYLEEVAKSKNEALNNKELNKRAKELNSKNARSVRKLLDAGATKKSDREKCELWIFEGESAGSGFRPNRNNQFQGCYFLKGKMMNFIEMTPMQVLKNQEASDIIVALGLNPNDPSDLSKIRYGKIILCTDMDFDGYSIIGQAFTLFGLHFIELLKRGMIYRAISPLWKVTKGTTVNYFLTNDEFNEYASKNKGFKSKYFKGIGSLKPEDYKVMLKDSKLERFEIDDESIEVINTWMGKTEKDKQRRKKLLKAG